MTYGNLKAYQQTTAQSAEYADPYTLVGMLMDNFCQRLVRARAAMEQGDVPTRAQEVDKALAILHALQGTLDHDQGGEIAGNLEALYDYMQRQVLLASARKDGELLDHVGQLMREIKAGWDGVGPQPQARDQAAPTSTDEQEAPARPRISVSG